MTNEWLVCTSHHAIDNMCCKKFLIGHFTIVYLVAKHLICSKAEGDLVMIEISILLAW